MSKKGLLVDVTTCHPDAEIPEYQNKGDACFDLKAVKLISNTSQVLWFKTGLKFDIPDGYVGLIYPRSSITETNLQLGNSVGVIDSGFRGEVQIRFTKNRETLYHEYKVGDRVAQMMILPYPQIQFREVDDLEESERGQGGFGSTGK